MNNNQEQYQGDEIDLRKLFGILWENKLIIFAITAFFGITGVAYALLAQQEWSAKAVVAAPLPAQLEQLQLRFENIVTLRDINKTSEANNTNNNTDLFADLSENKLFADFIQAFDSFDNKCEFLKINGYVQQKDMMDEHTLQGFFEKQANRISAKQKKNEPLFTLSFVAENAQEAKKRLDKYLNYIQAKEEITKNKQLAGKITSQIKKFTFNYQIKTADTFKRLQDDIIRTEYALRISKTAGIEAPVANLNNQSIFTIDLGAKALNEKLKILKEIKNPEFLNPALADVRLQLDSWQALPQEKVSISSFHFLQSPSESIVRDKPKRSLVVALAIFAGLMLGVMIVLFRANWDSVLPSPSGRRQC